MAGQTQSTQNPNAPLNLDEQKQKMLARAGALPYTLHGYQSVSAEWDLTIDQIQEIITKITRGYLDDLQTVTIEVDHRRGALYAYVWIPKDSKNITDNSLKGGNSSVNRSMTQFSKQIREFMDKFCLKENKRLLPAGNDNTVKGIEVAIERFMKVEFDENGFEYGKLIGQNFKRKTKLTLVPHFVDGDGDQRFGKLQYLEVSKRVKTNFDTKNPKPRRSFNAR